jgi:NADPH:quinone reductase-like Zn-dependent oxidoreductase
MQAAVMTGHGGPEVLEVRKEVPDPEPRRGEVLVEVGAAGVNMTDIWTRRGAYGRPGDPDAVAGWRGEAIDVPRIQGGDVAGRIVDVGPGTDRGLIGARVVLDPARYADRELVGVMGSEFDGGFAEYVAVAAQHAHEVGDSQLSDTQLACLPIAYGTAMGMLERVGLTEGETVLVTGASGGVGMAVIDLASARAARVIALTSSGHEAIVRQAGADEVVLRDDGGLPDASVDVVVDVVGGSGLGDRLELLRPDGRMVVCGAVAGPVVQLDLRRLYLQRRRLIGSTMHTHDQFRRLVEAARRGDIDPRITRTLPLAEIHRAQDELLGGEISGKIVLVPGG